MITMAEKKTSNAEELKKDKAQKDESKSKAQKADKKKSKKKNPFKSIGKFFKGVNAERKKLFGLLQRKQSETQSLFLL